MFKKVCCIGLAVLMICTMFNLSVFADTNTGKTGTDTKSTYVGEEGTYSFYADKHKKKTKNIIPFEVDATQYVEATAKVEVKTEDGRPGLYIGDEGSVTWNIVVPKTGMYQIGVEYFTVEGKASTIEKSLYIDGELPFNEASSLNIYRIWKNATETIEKDNRGNDKYVKQVEAFGWYTQFFRDPSGYYDNYLLFYLEEGEHTITLESMKEPVVIGKILFEKQKELPTYEEALADYQSKGLKEVQLSENLLFEGELADLKSSSMLAPVYDRSSPLIQPYDGAKLRMNIIGGGRFSIANMWVEYNVDNVPEDGLYQIVFKIKQQTARGLNITRRLYVNGEIPYQEAANIEYEYTTGGYENVLFGKKDEEEDEITEAYLVHLKKGANTIRIESALGKLGDFIMEVTDILENLNSFYRKIIVITGTNPDQYRNYDLDEKIPEIIEQFAVESERLQGVSADMAAVSGTSSYTAILDNVSRQLARLNKKPSRITKELSDFNANLASLGTWLSNVKQTDMNMDYFLITSSNLKLPKAEANFFQTMGHEFTNFFASFFEDYSSIGDTIASGEKSIEVWMNTGRDQATILKQLIDAGFTEQTGIKVQVKVVQGVLLQATVAGQAPDVALYQDQGSAINYAIRNAVQPLSQFEDFDEVAKRFAPQAMVPLELSGEYYGIPEQATFNMLFYRKDILEEIGVDTSNIDDWTWDDIYEILPLLERNNMKIGIPTSDVPSGSNAGVGSYSTILYQKGGAFYLPDKSRADLASEQAIETMKMWSDLYTSYGFPLSFDLTNRFVTGEMPLGITAYTLYNTLVIFAPQLKNMWGITNVPGTIQEDGTNYHGTSINVSVCMMMGDIEEEKKQAAWEFIKWWTDTEAQTDYAHELESLLGESGRYPTANLKAMENISWKTSDLRALQGQFGQVFGIPEVPGSYYLWRHLDNAFREIINRGSDPREVMVDYNIVINKEIQNKREEFGLE